MKNQMRHERIVLIIIVSAHGQVDPWTRVFFGSQLKPFKGITRKPPHLLKRTGQTTTPGNPCLTLCEECGFSMRPANEKTWKSKLLHKGNTFSKLFQDPESRSGHVLSQLFAHWAFLVHARSQHFSFSLRYIPRLKQLPTSGRGWRACGNLGTRCVKRKRRAKYFAALQNCEHEVPHCKHHMIAISASHLSPRVIHWNCWRNLLGFGNNRAISHQNVVNFSEGIQSQATISTYLALVTQHISALTDLLLWCH